MEKTTTFTQLQEFINEKSKEYDFIDNIDLDDIHDDIADEDGVLFDADEVINSIELLNEDRQITDEEIIYHWNAIDFLAKEDPSLQESIELAADLGFGIKDLNSETLASLLSSNINLADRQELMEEIRKFVE